MGSTLSPAALRRPTLPAALRRLRPLRPPVADKKLRHLDILHSIAPLPLCPSVADKKLRHLDILHNIASDPDAWVTRDGDLRTQQRQQQQASTGAGTSEVQLVQPGAAEGEWEPVVQPGGNSSASTFSPGGGGLGLDELQLFLQHVALMRELDDLKDKVGGRCGSVNGKVGGGVNVILKELKSSQDPKPLNPYGPLLPHTTLTSAPLPLRTRLRSVSAS